MLRDIAGSGAMGTIHRALDRLTGRAVAIKMALADGPALLARFVVERDALTSIDHPGVVRLVAHGTTFDGLPFLAMEWLDGEDLAARLERGPLTPLEVAHLGAGVARALDAVHGRAIVHRDVKPANLFLCGPGFNQVKLIDFGTARIAEHGESTNGALLGTPGYMAPEQASGTEQPDARSDLFALGAVMFECLAGQPPFSGEHVMAVLAKVLLEDAPRIGELCPEAPAALSSLVDRLLAKDREDRPRSAAEVAETLERLAAEMEAEGDPPLDRAPGALTSSPRFVRERRFLTVVAFGSKGAKERRVEPLGGRVDRLANGTTLITWMGAEDPAERAARAARCALLVQDPLSPRPIAVATTMSDASDEEPIGGALDRAAALLAGGEGPARTGILLDTATAALLDPRFRVERGPAGAELVAEEEISTEARTLLGRPSPFAGRERELRMLLERLDECIAECAPRATLVTAPAGAGKSRLQQELRRALEARPDAVSVWLGRGDCMSAGSAFATLGSVLRSIAHLRIGDALPERRRVLLARVARHVPAPELPRLAAFLGEIAGVPFPASFCPLLGPARQSPALMAGQMRRAWADFVAAECEPRPVLLVIDDLHWSDAPSIDLLDSMLGTLRKSRLFVLALGRPEVHDIFPGLWARRGVQGERLGGISEDAAARIVREMLGDSIDGAMTARIIDRADGNAFCLEEMIRAAAGGDGEDLPDTLLATVQARLDVLPADERAVLRAATVFGEVFWPGGVSALLAGTELEHRVGPCWRSLVSRELLVPCSSSRFPGERELSFRHALLRDGAYALLTEPDRVIAHRRAAEWLEEMGEDDAVMLAEHFEQGGETERATRHRLLAAQRALSGNDLRAALAHAERARPARGDVEQRARRAHLLNETCWIMGESAHAGAYADELIELSLRGSEPWCNAVGIKMMLALECGEMDALMSTIATFMGAPLPEERSAWTSRLYGMVTLALSMTGLRGPTAHFLGLVEASTLAEEEAPDPTTSWFSWTARAQWEFFIEGDLALSMHAHESALACCEQGGIRQFDAFNHALLSWVYVMLGAMDRAEAHARRAVGSSHVAGIAGLMSRVILSWIATARGETEEAIALAKGALDATRPDFFIMVGMARSAWAHALRSVGRWREAERQVAEALDVLRGWPPLRAIPVMQQYELCLVEGRPAEALRGVSPFLAGEGSFVIHPLAREYARLIRVEALDALGDHRALDDALIEERERILTTADAIDDSELRACFLRVPEWNARILEKAERRLSPRR